MKIGIDAQSTLGKPTGLGIYTSNLAEHMEKTGEITICRFDKGGDDLNTAERIKWENFGLVSMSREENVDLLHVPGFAGPMFRGAERKVTTVHDLIGMIYPSNLGMVSRFYWQKWLPACVKRSDLIIAVSENTKRDIIRLLGVPEERIRVVLNAVSDGFKPCKDENEISRVKSKYGLPDEFMLNVGTIEPRKNIPVLIEAFNSYSADKGGMRLVLAGKKDWGYEAAKKRMDELNISRNVIFTDYVAEEDLPVLYSLAKCFVYPSLYEGFGLPVLEALSCGCPVIASNVSSIPEVVGDAGILIAPDDAEGLKKALQDIDRSANLAQELSERSIQRAGMFSWDKAAAETIEAYRSVLNEY